MNMEIFMFYISIAFAIIVGIKILFMTIDNIIDLVNEINEYKENCDWEWIIENKNNK